MLTPEETEPITTLLKAKWRGGSTNTVDKHKRNYKIKTLNEKGKKQEISLLGMREDNNWILDAGQVDLFRLRNRIATEIWNEFASKPYYASKEPKAKSGVAGKVVEVILNNEYRGIYSLTEAMDRKELKLKKYDDINQEFHGLLWKVSSWDKAQFQDIAEDYDNTKETWHAFETKYPDFEDINPTDYTHVARDKKLTLAIWDLDASVGQDWHCSTPLHPEYVSPDTELGIKEAFNLYTRLSTLNVDNYNQKVSDRYHELRKTYFSEENLISKYQGYYNMLVKSGAASREENKWSEDSDIGGYPLNFKEEIEYIKNWITKRLNYLDTTQFPSSTGIQTVSHEKEKNKNMTTYNILGQKVNASYQGIKIIKGKKYYISQ